MKRRLGHVPALDGLRGVAILLVLVRHTFALDRWALGGSLGVDLFFVLSGFLITSLLLAEWDSNGRISLRQFYLRRAWRLLPALTAFLLVTLAVSVIMHPQRAGSLVALAAVRFSYAGNFLEAFTHGRFGFGEGFSQLWSLAEEEQFYLLWPILLIWLLRRGAAPGRIVLGLLVLAAAVSLERVLVIAAGATDERVWFAPDTHGDPILFGCVAALCWSYRLVRVPRSAALIAAAVAVALIAIFTVRVRGNTIGFYPMVLLPVFALAAAVFLIGVVEHGLARRVLTTRLLTLFGAISYALYLWHPILIRYLGQLGALFAIWAAILSYALIEEPIRKRRQTRRQAPERPAVPDEPVPAT